MRIFSPSLGYELKHIYFTKLQCGLNNYINLCKILADRNQHMMSITRSSLCFDDKMQMGKVKKIVTRINRSETMPLDYLKKKKKTIGNMYNVYHTLS